MSELRFDHIGVVVKYLAIGREFFQAALPISDWTEAIDDPGIGVSVQFALERSCLCYELIAPLGERSPIAGPLASGRNVLNHVAYRTADLAQAGRHLESLGCHATGIAHPAVAYEGHLVQFFVSPLRFIIELIESPVHEHAWVTRPSTDFAG